jgi:hypothetical protein
MQMPESPSFEAVYQAGYMGTSLDVTTDAADHWLARTGVGLGACPAGLVRD